ncbi:MAG: YhbY family RNA-binding protein [Erysipelothrix sp.]|nr:YhbY family RNA-binding protein [Erysipelothrix sp.]
MTLNNAQKRQLKGLANSLKSVLTIGKDGVSPQMYLNLSQALEAQELVKINILKTSTTTANEAAIILSSETKSEIVSIVGRVIVLYRPSSKKIISLVK